MYMNPTIQLHTCYELIEHLLGISAASPKKKSKRTLNKVPNSAMVNEDDSKEKIPALLSKDQKEDAKRRKQASQRIADILIKKNSDKSNSDSPNRQAASYGIVEPAASRSIQTEPKQERGPLIRQLKNEISDNSRQESSSSLTYDKSLVQAMQGQQARVQSDKEPVNKQLLSKSEEKSMPVQSTNRHYKGAKSQFYMQHLNKETERSKSNGSQDTPPVRIKSAKKPFQHNSDKLLKTRESDSLENEEGKDHFHQKSSISDRNSIKKEKLDSIDSSKQDRPMLPQEIVDIDIQPETVSVNDSSVTNSTAKH